MTDTSEPPKWAHPIRVAALLPNQVETFELTPESELRQLIGRDLDLLNLRKLRFSGTLSPLGAVGWLLKGQLGATISQACIVTGEPVSGRIDVPVTRHFLPDDTDYEAGEETEMPEDDSVEPLAETIDLGAIMIEALSLALPQYPRAPDAGPGDAQFSEAGKTPMSDADARPFAGLKSLRDTLSNEDE
ncbi:MAG: DUF177 domain-containing protein [Marinosulfonomonas sp.]|nr:DUF177 domain-containing protein [Marinosulfonomonas sp.]